MSNFRETHTCDNQDIFFNFCSFDREVFSDSAAGVTVLAGYRFDLPNGFFISPEVDATAYAGSDGPSSSSHARVLIGANMGGMDFFVAGGSARQDDMNGDSFGMGVQYSMTPFSSFFAGSEMRIEVLRDDFGSESENFGKYSETRSWETNTVRAIAIMRF